jgi:hypothetical protein
VSHADPDDDHCSISEIPPPIGAEFLTTGQRYPRRRKGHLVLTCDQLLDPCSLGGDSTTNRAVACVVFDPDDRMLLVLCCGRSRPRASHPDRSSTAVEIDRRATTACGVGGPLRPAIR